MYITALECAFNFLHYFQLNKNANINYQINTKFLNNKNLKSACQKNLGNFHKYKNENVQKKINTNLLTPLHINQHQV